MAACMHCSTPNPDHALNCESCKRSLFWSFDPMVGKKLGNFRILRKIGQGGCGAIYLAENSYIGSRYAVKILHTNHQADPEMMGRFQREAQILSNLEHKHILQFCDYGEISGGKFYLATEYLEGETLQQRLKRGQGISLASLAEWVKQLCEVLDFVHQHGVTHRDIKPSNLFLHEDPETGEEQLKLIDFGIAGMRQPAEVLTHQGEVLGTANYCSPEQAMGLAADGKADLYALGVVIFRCLTGRLPFHGNNPLEIRSHHVHTPAPLLSDAAPARKWVPELEAIVARALAKEPQKRPQSGADFWRDFQRAIALQTGLDGVTAAKVPPRQRATEPDSEMFTPLGFVAEEFLGLPIPEEQLPILEEQHTTYDKRSYHPDGDVCEKTSLTPLPKPAFAQPEKTVPMPSLLANPLGRRSAVARTLGDPAALLRHSIIERKPAAFVEALPILQPELDASPDSQDDAPKPWPSQPRKLLPWLALALGIALVLLPLAV